MTHEFACSPETLWELLATEEMSQRLQSDTKISRQVLETHRDGDVEVERVLCRFERELPAMMKKALRIDHFQYERQDRLDRHKNRLEWVVKTPFLTDRVDAGGAIDVSATDRGCRRVIDGDVDVKLPLMGSKMEQKLVGTIRGCHEAQAKIIDDMLSEDKP